MGMPFVKICGLTDHEGVTAAIKAGASMIGFVHFTASPRHSALGAITDLIAPLRGLDNAPKTVLLLVNPDDELCENITPMAVDYIQLHGTETPQRAAQIKQQTGHKIIKAIGVKTADDLSGLDQWVGIADYLLLDAKPPQNATRPGGNAHSFDWQLLQNFKSGLPWLLAGGLTSDNVKDALKLCRPDGLDCSSGVEAAPGVKSAALMDKFITACRLPNG